MSALPAGPAASRWPAAAFIGVGLALGLAAGAIVFFGLPLAGPGSASAAATPTPGPAAPAPVKGAPAPNFTLSTLDGDTVTLADFRGQVVLVNFWATWCGPCKAEMPLLQDRYTTLQGSGLEILAVNIGEDEELVRPYVNDLGLDFAIVLDPELTVNDEYRVLGYPTTITVDRDGNVVDVHVGAWLDEQLDAVLSRLGFGG